MVVQHKTDRHSHQGEACDERIKFHPCLMIGGGDIASKR